jgi:hypothetical protein
MVANDVLDSHGGTPAGRVMVFAGLTTPKELATDFIVGREVPAADWEISGILHRRPYRN